MLTLNTYKGNFWFCSIPLPTDRFGIGGKWIYFILPPKNLISSKTIEGVKREGKQWGIESEYYHDECYGTLNIPEGSIMSNLTGIPVTYYYGNGLYLTDTGAISGSIRCSSTVFNFTGNRNNFLAGKIHSNMDANISADYSCEIDVIKQQITVKRKYKDRSDTFTYGQQISAFQSTDPKQSAFYINFIDVVKLSSEPVDINVDFYSEMLDVISTYKRGSQSLSPFEICDIDAINTIAGKLQKVDCNMIMYLKDCFKITELFSPFISLLSSHSIKQVLNESSSAYLSYHYGMSLQVRDTIDIMEATSNVVNREDYRISLDAYNSAKIRGYPFSYTQFQRDVRDFSLPYQRCGNDPLSFISGLLFSSVGRHSIYPSYSYSGKGTIEYLDWKFTTNRKSYFEGLTAHNMENILQQLLQSFDISLSSENVWDMVPYSFVVDWFLTTDDYVELSESQDLFETFYHQMSLVSHKASYTRSTSYGVIEYEYYNRFLSETLPGYSYPLEINFSIDSLSKHGLEGAALIVQRHR